MPATPGLLAMPTILLNAALNLAPDRTMPVRGPDRVAVVTPMYNEERGAGRALASLLRQTRSPDELAVSINGCEDDTGAVVRATLAQHGFALGGEGGAPGLLARLERWRHPVRPLEVLVLDYRQQVAKSESINNLVASGLLRSSRVLLVDGDTVFAPDFIEAIRDHFYRLRLVRKGGRRRIVIEDVALQSGAVSSLRPVDAGPGQRFISRARDAEYAFSGIVRRGQARTVGRGAVFGRSRLFTVVGCGFAARRDLLPMPSDTLTEDHDLTLSAQAAPRRVEHLTPKQLADRGFRLVLGGVERAPTEVLDAHDEVELRHEGTARFVGAARMETEDPPHLSGYLRQIERWNGGGIQNALKRLLPLAGPVARAPNTRFVLWSALLENLLGLALLVLLPAALALHLGNPTIGVPWTALGAWFGLDLAVAVAMTLWGFYRAERDGGRGRRGAWRVALGGAVRSGVPLFVLKYLNAVSYVAAASRVVPAYLAEWRAGRRGLYRHTPGVPWERPALRHYQGRTAGAAASMLGVVLLVFVVALQIAPALRPINVEAWRLINGGTKVDMAEHARLPLATVVLGRSTRPEPPAPLRVNRATPRPDGTSEAVTVSAHRVELETVAVSVVPLAGGNPAGGPAAANDVPSPSGGAAPLGVPLRDAVGRMQSPAVPAVARGATALDTVPAAAGVSHYCRPGDLPHPADRWHDLEGDAVDARPLDRWELLVLARLAPIAPLVEGAATAYDVPADALLQVLMNESYLDPLAVGPTADKGLSQLTSDALTLLRGVSNDPTSRLYNPFLLHGAYNVFDPDFSVCGGAAKLSWAWSQPGVTGLDQAYALFINPIEGLRHGQVSATHRPAVDAMGALAPIVHRLGTAYQRYRRDPASVSPDAAALLAISGDVAAGRASVAEGYRRSYAVVRELRLDDEALYQAVFERLYPDARAEVAAPAH
jgi:cellulose synthase/poly-beta-1,6-N-acetylglucosamine synthase-like glycosyltransferase